MSPPPLPALRGSRFDLCQGAAPKVPLKRSGWVLHADREHAMEYRVTFFKDLLSSDGHKFKCPQCTVDIRRARTAARAVQAAKRRFERRRRMQNWKLLADYFELEVDRDEPTSSRHFSNA
jgi:predicted RNA-binding Zn-ribbon protein involved in translation (DUF1610 family)